MDSERFFSASEKSIIKYLWFIRFFIEVRTPLSLSSGQTPDLSTGNAGGRKPLVRLDQGHSPVCAPLILMSLPVLWISKAVFKICMSHSMTFKIPSNSGIVR